MDSVIKIAKGACVAFILAAAGGASAAPDPGSKWNGKPARSGASTVARYDFSSAEIRPAASRAEKDKRERQGENRLKKISNYSGRKTAESAIRLLGIPYAWGGVNERSGLDCSGFALRAYEKSLGILLPRVAADMARQLPAVRRDSLKAGDLVFFKTTAKAFSHVGVYIGGGYFVHSPRAGKVSRVDSLNAGYWSRRFTGVRRPAQLSQPGAEARVLAAK